MENNFFHLDVLAFDRIFYQGEALHLTVETTDGKYSFLPHHADVILPLVAGEIDIRTKKGEEIRAAAGTGVLHFHDNHAMVLIETCETYEEIDDRRAEEALRRAQERLHREQSDREHILAAAAMNRALSRLKFKHQLHH